MDEVRDRGLVEARLGLKPAAARDLEAYLAAVPTAADVGDIRSLLESLKARPALLN
jgi:regulator of sirC expression with transglutaminase-like and TPR domain